MIAASPKSRVRPEPIAGDEMRALVRVGLHGAFNGRPASALRLFEALVVLRPDQPFPYIGRALAFLALGRAADAIRGLEGEARAACPEDESITLFLGVALRFDRRERQAQHVLGALVKGGLEPSLADELLSMKLRY